MTCQPCGFDNRPSAVFCAGCGRALEATCSVCSRTLPPAGKFCDGCGAPRPQAAPASYTPPHLETQVLVSRSAIEGERKLVTVLFADLEGSTAIAERLGPEAMHAFMDGYIELLVRNVHQYQGTVNQFTGDGIMALFGAPVAHEDHAARALRAALSIRKELQSYAKKVEGIWHVPCRMRLGINTGIAVVGAIGDNLRRDYTAVGDTTNLAKRLEAIASPDTILVSHATYRLAGSEFSWGEAAPRTVRASTHVRTAARSSRHRHMRRCGTTCA